MASLFTKIVNGEIPSYKIAEDDNFYAFLDIFPLAKGHTLVIPKKEVDYLFDLDDTTYLELQAFAKKLAIALKKAIPCKKVGVVVLGLEVPHAHIHLIPMQSEQDVNFANPKKKFTPEEFDVISQSIRKCLD
jgi:histidine triad (HIT) family protein